MSSNEHFQEKKREREHKKIIALYYLQHTELKAMKQYIAACLLFFTTLSLCAQNSAKDKLANAEQLIELNLNDAARTILHNLKKNVDKADTLYDRIVWYYITADTRLEQGFRAKEDFTNALKYALEALDLIRENKHLFDEKFAAREAWMTKNIIVSYFGLGKIDEANKYKEVLYKGYKEKSLPDGINEYFNYDFFTMDDKNVWGYEWFEELPEDRMSKSFTKIVYYVYSRNADGTDKEQLYRLHVLMFHKIEEKAPDYILTLMTKGANGEVSRSLYDYMYFKNIDYKKLKEDIKKVIPTIKLPAAKPVAPVNN